MLIRFLDRIREPSTWAGIAAASAALGVNVDAGLWRELTTVGGGLAAIAAMVIGEKKGEGRP